MIMNKETEEYFRFFITSYLDAMPVKSKVAMYELTNHMRDILCMSPDTNVTYNQIYKIVSEVIFARKDFVVNKGRGACKIL